MKEILTGPEQLTSVPMRVRLRGNINDSGSRHVCMDSSDPSQRISVFISLDVPEFVNINCGTSRGSNTGCNPFVHSIEESIVKEGVGESAPLSTFQINDRQTLLISHREVSSLAMRHAGDFVEPE